MGYELGIKVKELKPEFAPSWRNRPEKDVIKRSYYEVYRTCMKGDDNAYQNLKFSLMAYIEYLKEDWKWDMKERVESSLKEQEKSLEKKKKKEETPEPVKVKVNNDSFDDEEDDDEKVDDLADIEESMLKKELHETPKLPIPYDIEVNDDEVNDGDEVTDEYNWREWINFCGWEYSDRGQYGFETIDEIFDFEFKCLYDYAVIIPTPDFFDASEKFYDKKSKILDSLDGIEELVWDVLNHQFVDDCRNDNSGNVQLSESY